MRLHILNQKPGSLNLTFGERIFGVELRSPLSAVQIYTFIFKFRDFFRDIFRDFLRDFFHDLVCGLKERVLRAERMEVNYVIKNFYLSPSLKMY